jgi:threonine synthase
MTTLGGNITALGLEGKFDYCQKLVKRAFADRSLEDLHLSSANSINIGRLLPQSIYYFYSYSRVVDSTKEKIIFSVPCGNFGNLTGGLIARRLGLPVERFIAAVNENDEFPKFLATGKYQKVEPSRVCISNAMNVGHPSNLARIFDMYGGHLDENGAIKKMPDLNHLRRDILSFSISDSATKQAIIHFHQKFNKIIEPHGAVGWAAFQRFRKHFPKYRSIKAISFETADPAKFPKEISRLLHQEPSMPISLQDIQKKEEIYISDRITSYQDFKEFLQKKYIE